MAKLTFNDVIEALERGGVDVDKISKRGHVWTVKRGYFYRPSNDSPEQMGQRIQVAIPNALIVQTTDDWNPWPKDSNFVVKFELIGNVIEERKKE